MTVKNYLNIFATDSVGTFHKINIAGANREVEVVKETKMKVYYRFPDPNNDQYVTIGSMLKKEFNSRLV
jgi:hypothetical protein